MTINFKIVDFALMKKAHISTFGDNSEEKEEPELYDVKPNGESK